MYRNKPTDSGTSAALVGERHGGDLFVPAAQVMNTAIATNWHVAAAHTKA